MKQEMGGNASPSALFVVAAIRVMVMAVAAFFVCLAVHTNIRSLYMLRLSSTIPIAAIASPACADCSTQVKCAVADQCTRAPGSSKCPRPMPDLQRRFLAEQKALADAGGAGMVMTRNTSNDYHAPPYVRVRGVFTPEECKRIVATAVRKYPRTPGKVLGLLRHSHANTHTRRCARDG